MDIYLIRHTQTATAKGLCYGQTDVALADSFADEVTQLTLKLPAWQDNCRFYSSPLGRCLQLAHRFSHTIAMDERLLELNFGDWEGRRFDDLPPESVKQWTENFVQTAPPNGESFIDLCQRAGAFWQELLQQELEQAVIITHAGVIRALLAHILKLPLANAFQFRVDCGSVHKLQNLNQYTYIHYLNA